MGDFPIPIFPLELIRILSVGVVPEPNGVVLNKRLPPPELPVPAVSAEVASIWDIAYMLSSSTLNCKIPADSSATIVPSFLSKSKTPGSLVETPATLKSGTVPNAVERSVVLIPNAPLVASRAVLLYMGELPNVVELVKIGI